MILVRPLDMMKVSRFNLFFYSDMNNSKNWGKHSNFNQISFTTTDEHYSEHNNKIIELIEEKAVKKKNRN